MHDDDEEILQDFLVEAGEILELLSEQLVDLERMAGRRRDPRPRHPRWPAWPRDRGPRHSGNAGLVRLSGGQGLAGALR